MKSPPRARSPTLLRILLYSGFGTKCGAPHFVPLLPKPQDHVPTKFVTLKVRLGDGEHVNPAVHLFQEGEKSGQGS